MKLRALAASVIAALTALACVAVGPTTPARAAFTHNYEFSFGSLNARSIAVDESTGDIYVLVDGSRNVERAPNFVYKYTAAGAPAEFFATKQAYIEVPHSTEEAALQIAVDNSPGPAKGDFYVANSTSGVFIFNASGQELGRLPSTSRPLANSVGVAVDAAGNVYVSALSDYVYKYQPTVNPVAETDFVEQLSGLGGYLAELAVDSQGNVWLLHPGAGHLEEYDASQFTTPVSPIPSVTLPMGTPAVDLSNSYAYIDFGSEIGIYDSAANFIESIKPVEGSAGAFKGDAVAVNGGTGTVYISDNSNDRIDVFSPSLLVPDATTGAPGLTTSTVTLTGTVNPDGMEAGCHFEYGTAASNAYANTVPCASSPGSGSGPVPVSAQISGLKAGTRYHYRLVATNVNGSSAGQEQDFALPFPPEVDSAWVTDVGLSSAIVEAVVRPMAYNTTLHIEYGRDTAYGSISPVPDVDVGAGEGAAQVVRAHLANLQPGTTYHYRVVATNVNGVTDGLDQTFTTMALPPPKEVDACPNAPYRVGASAELPDCRAYEMVSPVDKNGGDVLASQELLMGEYVFDASASGNALQYDSTVGIGETKGSGPFGRSVYLASRGSSGWSNKGIIPTPANTDIANILGRGETLIMDFSDSFGRSITLGYELPNVEGAQPGTENLYLEDTSDASLLATVSNAGKLGEPLAITVAPWALRPLLGGSSSDLEVVAFQSIRNLLAKAKGAVPKVYAFEHGALKLVGVLPNGSVPSGGSVLAREGKDLAELEGNVLPMGTIAHKDTVSQDGTRIFFVSPASGQQQLYLREHGEKTVLVSESEDGSTPTAENVHFQAASPDGGRVIFSTTSRLLSADPGGGGAAIYLYTDSPQPDKESNLTFIARSTESDPNELIKGISEDASHVYFASDQALFLWDEAGVREVAPDTGMEYRVSPDGRWLAFMSHHNLIPADKISLPPGNTEIYVYDANNDSLTCASCARTGALAKSGVTSRIEASHEQRATPVPNFVRYLSSDGKFVFFNTEEALVPQDVNGTVDAYEYNTETGQFSLLSTGTSEYGTWFVGAGADGRDVFLATRQQLSPWDPDRSIDVYDARAGGGLPGPPAVAPPCDGDACQGTPLAPPSFTSASEFTGAGNPSFVSAPQSRAKAPTKAQRLKRALTVCKSMRTSRRTRVKCEARVHRRFGTGRSAAHASRAAR